MSDAVDSEISLRSEPEEARRDFLYLTAGAMAAVGTGLAVWPLIDSMNPAADVRALSATARRSKSRNLPPYEFVENGVARIG